jgi:hypothetical protein
MVYEHRKQRLLTVREFVMRMLQHFGIASVVILGSLVIGIVGYHQLAHMRWVDSFLNAAMILGGMGPVSELPTDTSKIFAGCYALYSGVVFIAVAGIMIAPVAHRVLHRLHVND